MRKKASKKDVVIPGPTLEDFADARRVLTGVAQITPMELSRYLGEELGQPVYLKCENLQRTGSYKIRGAYYRMSKLTEEEKSLGVVAASAGNHAQGVAFAAQEQGIKATSLLPLELLCPSSRPPVRTGRMWSSVGTRYKNRFVKQNFLPSAPGPSGFHLLTTPM